MIPLLLVSGCVGMVELSENPSHILSEGFSPEQISVYGVRCYDNKSAIDENKIDRIGVYGKNIIGLKRMYSVAYKMSGDRVIGFSLKDELAEQTGLTSQNVMAVLDGKYSKTGIVETVKSYDDKITTLFMGNDIPEIVMVNCDY